MHRFALASVLLLAIAVSAAAEDTPTTNPIRYTWIATSCANWNCAAAAFVLAGGDKYLLVLPTGREEHPWLILKRVEQGSIYIPEDEPYGCHVFDTVRDASSYFDTLDGCRGGLILNVPDGGAVVLALHHCGEPGGKRRASR